MLGICARQDEELAMTAYDYVRALSVDIGPRPVGSENNRKSAEYLHRELENIGVPSFSVQEFRVRPSFWSGTAAFALIFALLILVTFWLFPPVSLILAIILPILVILEVDMGKEITLKLLPSAVGRNVIGRNPPKQETKEIVVLCAHHDSKTQVIPISLRGPLLLFVLLCMVFLIVATFIRNLALTIYPDASFLTEYLGIGIIIILAYYLIFALLNFGTRLALESPGAEDNAAAVGIILEVAKSLRQNPLSQTEVWYVFTDAEEIGMKGAQIFAKHHKAQLEDALVYNIEGCGTDAPLRYSEKEKAVRTTKTSQRAIDILLDVAQKTGEEIAPIAIAATTDGYQFARYGYHVTTIWRYKEEIREVAHTPHDNIGRLDPDALQKTVGFLDSVLRLIDRNQLWFPK